MKNTRIKFNNLCVVLCGIVLCFVVLFAMSDMSLQTAFAYEDASLNFEENSLDTEALNIETYSTKGFEGYDLNKDENKYKLSNAKYIENSNYFRLNPKHAKGLASDNKIGTCTTIAMQMLLGYHNYFSDRRLIPKFKEDGTKFLENAFGNISEHPYQDRRPVKDYGCADIGTADGLYRELLSLTNLQTIPAVKNAAVKFVEKYASSIKGNVSISAPIFSEKDARAEIDAGRPIILGFDGIKKGEIDNYHVVVAYGYGNYNGEAGFIVHYGYYKSDDKGYEYYWVPASWIGFCIKMSVNHEHKLRADNTNLNANGEPIQTNCIECGYSLPSFGVFDFTVFYDYTCIYGLRHDNIDEVYVPSAIHGKPTLQLGIFANNSNIVSVKLSAEIENIGGVFENCSNLKYVEFTTDVKLKSIGDYAFNNCPKLERIEVPETVTEIGESAFFGCKALQQIHIPDSVDKISKDSFKNCTSLHTVSFSPNNSIKYIYAQAFENCEQLKNISTLTSTIFIDDNAFSNCIALTELRMVKQFFVISELAFKNCPKLVLYSTRSQIDSSLKKLNIPVVANCTFSKDYSYLESFVKSNDNPYCNENQISNILPKKDGYKFFGWNTAIDASGDQFFGLSEAPNVVLYAMFVEDDGCVAQGTLITLADGSQVPVENLTGNEMLLVWNMFTGQFDIAPILFIDKDIASVVEIIKLTFSDGTTVKVISEHAFWNVDLNEYVFLRNDANKYLGNRFNKQTRDLNGNMIWNTVELVQVDIYEELNIAYSPVTYGHLCYYVNGMLSMPGATEGLINIFKVNADNMQIDESAFADDVEKYGLFTYEELSEIVQLSEDMFNAVNGKYLKIAIGKGLIDVETIERLIIRYAQFFS